MLDKLKSLRDGAGEAWRAHKERVAVKRMEKEAAMLRDQHAHSRFWLLNVPAIATICAALTEWYWAVLFCLAATGTLAINWATSVGSAQAASGAWHFELSIQNVAVLLGLILATMPIVMLSMIWLPVQFAMRGAGRFRRGTLITVGLLANFLVIVSGTVVMNYNRQDQVRAALVTEQRGDAGRTLLASNVQDLRDELATLMNHRSTYIATAASVGAVAFERDYVQQARRTNDARLPLLERALGAAHRADELRQQIGAARQTVAQANPQAATQARVQDNVGVGLNTFAQYVEVYRPPFVAFCCTLIGIFGAWWVLAMLERLNPRDVIRSGWASEAERIEDMRDQPIMATQRMQPTQEQLRDADTKEIIVDKDGDIATVVREHTRKKRGSDGKPIKVMVQPKAEPDETGTPPGLDHGDGGDRSAALHGEHEPVSAVALAPVEEAPKADSNGAPASGPEPEPAPANEQHPEISEEDALAAQETLMMPNDGDGQADNLDEQPEGESAEPEATPVETAQDSLSLDEGHDNGLTAEFARANGRAPETDPRRLIAAE